MGFSHPVPTNGAIDVALSAYIAAVATPPPFPGAGDTITYTITSPAVESSGALVYPGDWGGFLWGRWTTPTLVNSTTYTWEFTTSWGASGGPYTFTTVAGVSPPNQPINPIPIDIATDVILGTAQVSWADGGGADDFDVYFGPSGSMVLQSSGQVGTTWTIPVGTLSYGVTYQWRIDANNAYGTTTGNVWSFTALVFEPPYASGDDPSGDGTPGVDGGEFGGVGGTNFMRTVKRLIAACNNTIFFQDG